MLVIIQNNKELEKLKGELELLPLHKLGAREDKQNSKVINFGLFLPGVSAEEDYRLMGENYS